MLVFKVVPLISLILIYILVTIILRIILLLFPSGLRFRMIGLWTRIFDRFLRSFIRIRVVIEGDSSLLAESGNLIISNHLGYLDGILLGSLFALVYTSKTQMKSWPLLGWMSLVSGTIFIDRKKKARVPDYIQQTADMLKRRVNVLVFPEGTSTNGERLLPFQPIHFQAPLIARSGIVPVSIIYTRVNKEAFGPDNRDRVCWYGQVSFYQHLLSLLESGEIEVKVVLHPKIDLSGNDYSRKDLSQILYKIIASSYPLYKD